MSVAAHQPSHDVEGAFLPSSRAVLSPLDSEDRYVYAAQTAAQVPSARNAVPKSRFLFLLMAPAILILAAISLYPFFWLLYMSVMDVGINAASSHFVGLTNYTRLLHDDDYQRGWILLLKYSAVCLFFEVGIGITLALILNGNRFEKYLVTILLMPMMVSPAIAGLLWYYLYNATFGWYHWIFESLGLLGNGSILADPDTALYGIALVDIWQWTPLITLITLAGLKRVPNDQLEANLVDGAGPFRNFLDVVLPNIYPFLMIGIMLRFMDNFRFIDTILVLTGGGPGDSTKILPVYLFDVSFQYFKLGRGAAIAVTLLIVTIVLGKLLVKIFDTSAKVAKQE
jgi:multiple sugar transport system permease protein